MQNLVASTLNAPPVLEWYPSDIEGELEYRLTDPCYFLREEWFQEYRRLTGRQDVRFESDEFQHWIHETKRKQVTQEIWQDFDYWNREWEEMLDRLQEILEKHNLDGHPWRIDGENLGWTHQSGYKSLDCSRQKQISFFYQCPCCQKYQNYKGRCRISDCDAEVRRLSRPHKKIILYQDAREFLREILPETDCRFCIYETQTGLKIVNYHHDAPTGEFYFCTPNSEE